MASSPGTYLVVADQIGRQIAAGDLAGKLPSEPALAEFHNVSRGLIRRALEALKTGQMVDSIPGKGWYVSGFTRPKSIADRMTEIFNEDGLKVGDAFPSEFALCRRLAASRTSVRRALAPLENQGLLAVIQGKGRTVRQLPSPPQTQTGAGHPDTAASETPSQSADLPPTSPRSTRPAGGDGSASDGRER